MKGHMLKILAWAIFGLVIAFVLGFIVLGLVTAQLDFTGALDSLNALLTAFVGALVAARRGSNPIGWIILTIGLSLAVSTFLESFILYSVSLGLAEVPGTTAAIWAAQWIWIVPMVGVTLLLFLFPTGVSISPRWRWALIFSGVLSLGLVSWLAVLTPFVIETPQGTVIQVANPIGLIPWSDSAAQLIFLAALIIIPLVLALASMLVRFVRARGIERTQIKWFMYAAALFIVVLSVAFATQSPFVPVLVTITAFGMPVSIAIALFRYRLYDIDLIIRRTLTYGLVVALLVVVYFGSIILLQQLFASVTGRNEDIITVLSTLAIAALFVPLRNKIRDLIDRQFNRRKYNAQQVLQDFAATVRDETDLEKLTGRLVEVVEETMQPKSVSVWLRELEHKSR